MNNWEQIVRTARDCHTKEAWERLFAEHGAAIAQSHTSKPISDVYKLLSNDPQCLQYDPSIWTHLLRGCLSSWNTDLGREISEFTQSVASAKIAIPAAEIHMESGSPGQARKIASRALRLTGLEDWEQFQLQMIVCKSYVEEGKHKMALRLLNKLESVLGDTNLKTEDLANLLNNMARAKFFLGRYLEAAKFFYRAYQLFLEQKDWEAAARGLFNTAACYHNSGDQNQSRAFELVAECKHLSETHQLSGPLSHCYAFYGTDDYHHGNFAGASEQFRKALEYLPLSDKSFRRLHILSMLSLTYMKTGRYQLAQKFGNQTLDLASLDESERFKSRYLHLHAELYWQEGEFEKSQTLLEDAIKPLFTRGVHTLEELSTLSQYFVQAALLNETATPSKVQISDQLKHNTVSWLEYLDSLAQNRLTQRKFQEAYKVAETCYKKASEYGAKYYRALGLLSMVQCKIAQKKPLDEIIPLQREFEIAVGRMVETPLWVHIEILRASIAYRRGEFDEVKRFLVNANKLKRISYHNKVIIQSWLATIEGHSAKLSSHWQIGLVARATSLYFGPTIEAVDDYNFNISGHYLISLERHSTLAKLLRFLLTRNNFSATSADLQQNVWGQSTSLQGWQQKIRNTVMRLRDLCPYSMAPLILHSDHQLRLFSEAVHVKPLTNKDVSPEDEILRLLVEGPMSSIQLANRINVSQATTKRILKKLAESDRVTVAKVGRKVFYHAPRA